MNRMAIKLVLFIIMGVFVAHCNVFAQTGKNVKYKYNTIKPKKPTLTKSMMPAVAEYKKGNYVGAMVDLKKIVEKEPNNMYAKYYLALCYTQLGYRGDAQALYQEVADNNANYSLTYYSHRALICIDNPDNSDCLPPKKVGIPESNVNAFVSNELDDDMTKFIRSGERIHPSAMDKITRERMERKIQADAYERAHAQDENNKQ